MSKRQHQNWRFYPNWQSTMCRHCITMENSHVALWLCSWGQPRVQEGWEECQSLRRGLQRSWWTTSLPGWNTFSVDQCLLSISWWLCRGGEGVVLSYKSLRCILSWCDKKMLWRNSLTWRQTQEVLVQGKDGKSWSIFDTSSQKLCSLQHQIHIQTFRVASQLILD